MNEIMFVYPFRWAVTQHKQTTHISTVGLGKVKFLI